MSVDHRRTEVSSAVFSGRGGRGALPSIVAVVAAVVVLLMPTSTPARAAGTSLHDVDWPAVFANDPTLTVVPPRSPGEGAPGLHLLVPLPNGHDLDGYVLVPRDIEYGDLDGDGADEAAIYIFGGISFYCWGFLLYHQDEPAPRRILVQTGDRIGAKIENGHLILSQPFFWGFEMNGSGSSTTRTVMDLVGDELVPRSSEIEPHDVQLPTVEAFYRLISQRSYTEAYKFLSPDFQAAHPYAEWRAGYATTQRLDVKTTPGDTPSEVWISLTSIDQAPDGSRVMHQYRGSWTLVFSPERKHWVLDQAVIEQAP
jgi:hypothetical protein